MSRCSNAQESAELWCRGVFSPWVSIVSDHSALKLFQLRTSNLHMLADILHMPPN